MSHSEWAQKAIISRSSPSLLTRMEWVRNSRQYLLLFLQEHHFASRYPQGQTTPFRPEHEATLRQRFPSSVSVPPTNVTYSSVGSNQGPHITAPYARYHRSTAGPVTFSKSESLRQVGGWMPHQPTQRVASPVPYSSQLTKMMADGRVPKR